MIRNLPLDLVVPNLDQPRKTFDDAALDALAASIKSEGLIQPITVRRLGDGRYGIIAGERRYRAHLRLASEGVDTIRCRVTTADDSAVAFQAIIENIQREDVPPMEESDAFARLIEMGHDEAEIAERLGLTPFRVRWRLQLQNLCADIRRLLERQIIDRQTALELARLPRHDDQRAVLKRVNRGELKGWKAVRTAVEVILNPETALTLDLGDAPDADDVATARRVSANVEKSAEYLTTNWDAGECKIAAMVNPGEASKIADQLALIQQTARHMERALRNAVAARAA